LRVLNIFFRKYDQLDKRRHHVILKSLWWFKKNKYWFTE